MKDVKECVQLPSHMVEVRLQFQTTSVMVCLHYVELSTHTTHTHVLVCGCRT